MLRKRCLGKMLLTCLSLTLAAFNLLIAPPADALPGQDALEKQCLDAKTPQQCRQGVLACTQLEAVRQKEPASRERDLALAKLWDSLFECEYYLGLYGAAEKHSRQLLALRQNLLGPEHSDIGESLNNLALVLGRQGKYAETEMLLRQALAMMKKLLGPEHPNVAQSLNNLAVLRERQGQYKEAESLHHEALAIQQKLLGPEHSAIAQSLNNLALVLARQGRHAEAEPLHRQVLAMLQKLLGPEHPRVATSLDNLAVVLESQGKYGEGEQLHRQVLGMRQKLWGPEHLDVALSLNNLANVLYHQGKYGEGERLHRQVLSMRQKLLGSEHPDVALSLHNLASILDRQEKYSEAEPLYRQALAMWQKLLGSEHPDVALALTNLAGMLHRQGKYGESEPPHRQALALRQKMLGPDHPYVAESLNSLGRLLLTQGRLAAALDPIRQAARIRERQVRATISETRMQALIEDLRSQEDTVYSLLLSADSRLGEQTLALTEALLRKGRAAEAGALANRLLHRKLADPTVQKRFDEWQSVRQRLETLIYGTLGSLKPGEYQARLKELQLQAESLEAQLAQAIPEIRALQPPVFDDIVPAVAKRIPKEGVLVEVVWMRPYQAQATNEASRWGAPRFVALLLFPDQHIAAVDLGEVAEVDELGRDLLAALRNPSSDPKPAGQALYRKLVAPLLPLLASRRDLFLSLDGSLNLIPLVALHDGADYLLGRYRFHYLTSGRDLLREPSRRTPGSPLLLANPDFGQADPAIDQSQSLYQRLAPLPPLPGTQREAEALGKLLGVQALTGRTATEIAVRSSGTPAILHIATHGLFFNDVDMVRLSGPVRGSFSPQRAVRTKNVSAPATESIANEIGAMNRSALALAGVLEGQRAKSPAQDGLLTAEEARSLDLDGTQLVVLSACETGQGALSAGQGVYGLRRAFLLAGAETLVTSLWRVHDQATGELMELYYRTLLSKQKPGDRLNAMVEAMQELRARPGRSHPYYWAPFLVIGQDGPLRPLSSVLARR